MSPSNQKSYLKCINDALIHSYLYILHWRLSNLKLEGQAKLNNRSRSQHSFRLPCIRCRIAQYEECHVTIP